MIDKIRREEVPFSSISSSYLCSPDAANKDSSSNPGGQQSRTYEEPPVAA